MRALSLFSGAGGMDLGLESAGIEIVGQCEIDERAGEILKHHWPDVPLIKDVRDVRACACDVRSDAGDLDSELQQSEAGRPVSPAGGGTASATTDLDGVRCEQCGGFRRGTIDLVCGGFPCQDISIAGHRKGLDGDRSGLWWEFHRIIGELRPRWAIIENVAGLLSSNDGRDLGAILGALGELGYGFAYRVLDAQFFGVPQRRRRVFIVASARVECAAQVLLEPEGGNGHLEAGFTSRKATSRGSVSGADGGSERLTPEFVPMNDQIGTMTTAWGGHYDSNQEVVAGSVQPGFRLRSDVEDTVGTLTATGAGSGAGPDDQTAQAGHLIPVPLEEHGDLLPDKVGTITAGMEKNKMGAPEVDANLYLPVAYSVTPESGQGADLRAIEINVANSLTATDGKEHDRGTRIVADLAVRRLTPVEAERLMGWPDDWTRWKPDGSEMADTHRYRMAGNGVVGTVAEWLGCRIRWVDSLS